MTSKQIVVVKLGGSVLNQLHPTFYQTCTKLTEQNMLPIIVHGGGVSITHWMKRIGKKPQFINGRRVTDQESLSIVMSVLGGQINKQLVSTFINAGATAIGLSGIDLNLLSVKPIDPTLGYVGEVTQVHVEPLICLLNQGWIPVIASLGIDSTGQYFNVNADEAAAAVAQAVKAEKLFMVSDVDGVLNAHGELIKYLDATMIQHFIKTGEITGGMIPKVQSGINALQGSVKEVRIVNGKNVWSHQLSQLIGTRLVKEGAMSDVFIPKLSSVQ